ncbi:MAG: hypothetical protein Q4F57_02555 [Weeksellaceae bacterium]|nr:hypothetical protein [Weeksellaceae bacterium]
MKKVKMLATGEIFEADNELQLVNLMRMSTFAQESTVQNFMLQYAKRAVINNNEDIRATDPKSFVEDLVKFGHIEFVDNKGAMN